ncbi:EamA family transporter [Caldilinea sp.]|uniref:DMT family transporter n=1 Tax=Caldilinea sp. TaxID=2293560 RepID=UPI002BC78966|nr:EamA family transporter [Caldilinea sp.]HRA64882.1 EamA family transporter [Caldilinea sp.]
MNSISPAVNRGFWLVLAAAFCWGTTGTAQAFAPAGATPLAIGALRLLVGGSALLCFAVGRRQLHWQGWPFAATAIAIGAIAGYQLFFFAGVARTGVAVGTVVAIGSAPMLAGLMGLALLGERFTRRWLLSTLLAVAGCTLLIATGGDLRLDGVGVLLAIGAGAAYSLYTIACKELLRVQPPDAVTAVAFFGGALLLAPLLFFVDLTWLAQPRGVIVALQLGLVATALAYMLFIRGLMMLPSATAVTLALAEPLTAATLGVLVLGEQLTLPALGGMALIFAGLFVLSVGVRRQPPALAAARQASASTR